MYKRRKKNPFSKLFRLFSRKDALLVFLALVVVFLLMERYAGIPAEVHYLPGNAPCAAAESAAPVLGAPTYTAAEASMQPEERIDIKAIPPKGSPVRFVMHNVHNYFVEGEQYRSRYVLKPKPKKEREAVADVIASAKPAIVGLVEIGGPVALQDLRERLAARHCEFPYFRVLPRKGEDRALAVLSKYPIVQDHSQANYPLMGQQRRKMLRGILDVTIKLPDSRLYRILGAHLKSRVAQNADAASALRQKEACTLARYVQGIVRSQPGLPLLVFGDWNDGPSDPAVRIMVQGVSEDAAMVRLSPEDSRGEEWTHYYKGGKEYCVYDQIFVSPLLRKRMKKSGGIVDIPAAATASDHRALWCDLR